MKLTLPACKDRKVHATRENRVPYDNAMRKGDPTATEMRNILNTRETEKLDAGQRNTHHCISLQGVENKNSVNS